MAFQKLVLASRKSPHPRTVLRPLFVTVYLEPARTETFPKATIKISLHVVQMGYKFRTLDITAFVVGLELWRVIFLYQHLNTHLTLHGPQRKTRIQQFIVGFEVFAAVTMKNAVFWGIKTQYVPHRKHYVPTTEPSRLMPCKI
jgi:hypothetical protein